MLKLSDVPAPDTLIEYNDGTFGPIMFHYVGECEDLEQIARENGFDCSAQWMEHDAAAQHLVERHFENGEQTVGEWQPAERDGWKLCAKHDTEEGPIAIYIRPRADAPHDGGGDA